MLKVGVVGGGQLARMMQPPAIALGIELRVFAENADSAAHLSASTVGNYLGEDELLAFAQEVDVITFDHEHVPVDLLRKIETAGVAVHPKPEALVHAQNKLVMRRRLRELGLPQPAWTQANSEAEIRDFLDSYGPQIIVKTPIGGYDGKGVRVVSDVSQVSDWLGNLADLGGALLLEQKVAFKRELAQLIARSPSGQTQFWPLVETIQKSGVCSEVIAPARADGAAAYEIALAVAQGLDVTGVMAVELFEDEKGNMLVNELAMRPHNSGHFSIEGSVTSQFEQHLRAVLDLPLGSTRMLAPVALMLNLLGVDDSNSFQEQYPEAMLAAPDIKFHLYGKAPRLGRKMGHLTILGEDLEAMIQLGNQARDLLYKSRTH